MFLYTIHTHTHTQNKMNGRHQSRSLSCWSHVLSTAHTCTRACLVGSVKAQKVGQTRTPHVYLQLQTHPSSHANYATPYVMTSFDQSEQTHRTRKHRCTWLGRAVHVSWETAVQ